MKPDYMLCYTQSSVLRNVNLRSRWWGGARKRINQKGSEPGNAIISGDSGYGRNTTGGWVADDPRVVPLRPRACGVVVLGLVYRSPV
jgi:hypothetical protein